MASGVSSPHRPDGLGLVLDHGSQDHHQLFVRIAKGRLFGYQLGLGAGRRGRVSGGLYGQRARPAQPGAVRASLGQLLLDAGVVHQPASDRIHRDHLARAQLAVHADAFGRHRHRAGLGRGGHQAVFGDQVAARPQAVAVKGRAHHPAIGEHQGGGTVPRLGQAGVEGQEVAHAGARAVGQVGHALPSRGHEHSQRVARVAAALHQQLGHIVEHGRVAALGVGHRAQVGGVDGKVGGQQRLAGLHPGQVALQGVDLAVVAQHAEGLGIAPGGGRVGAVALVEDHQRHGKGRVLQVSVKSGDLRGQEQAFVNDSAAGTGGGDVRAEGEGLLFEALAGHEEPLLELNGVLAWLVGTQQRMPQRRHGGPRLFAEHVQLGGHGAPGQQLDLLGGKGRLR